MSILLGRDSINKAPSITEEALNQKPDLKFYLETEPLGKLPRFESKS